MKKWMFLLSFATVIACNPTEDASPANEGNIKVFLCSRGCYQYLLEVGEVLYAPDSVPEELKQDGQAVRFEGEPTDGTTTIYKPSPNDAPVPDFEAPNFHIISMEAK